MKYLNKFFSWLTSDSRQSSNTILPDTNILFSAILLLTIGVIMVYSASIAYAAKSSGSGNQYFFVMRHVASIAIGLVAGLAVYSRDTRFWEKHANHIMIIIIILLIIVLIPHVGRVVNGSRRWIPLILFNLQPSELAKIGMAIYLSNYFKGKSLSAETWKEDAVRVGGVFICVATLLLAEPDMGSTGVVFIISLTLLYLSGLNSKAILGVLISGIFIAAVLVIISPYRMKRVTGFIDPFQDALGKGYQLSHSLLAFGHGGWFGVGLGNSIEKLYYLPEAHTDFIMAIIGEEFGALGVIAVLTLFWIIFYRGFNVISAESKRIQGRQFQALLAQGISIWFLAQALINTGVAIGILPTKGLTLPFISFGGSSILVNCMALSILLKIDYENKILNSKQKKHK
ncbi:MAG: putative lipid II flippase FtsW [Burkholderiales bacterium]|nr:putative lipid II flippase FtsW [Burkholderiales bacterium]